jgi:hypothetical protein
LPSRTRTVYETRGRRLESCRARFFKTRIVTLKDVLHPRLLLNVAVEAPDLIWSLGVSFSGGPLTAFRVGDGTSTESSNGHNLFVVPASGGLF